MFKSIFHTINKMSEVLILLITSILKTNIHASGTSDLVPGAPPTAVDKQGQLLDPPSLLLNIWHVASEDVSRN